MQHTSVTEALAILDDDLQLHRPCTIPEGGPCLDCQRRSQVKAQIAEAFKGLKVLVEEHKQATVDMNRSHDPFISRAPAEIASFIFQLCVPHVEVKGDVQGTDFHDQARVLYTLGAVCQGWRRIALSTPHLWRTISLYLGSKCFKNDVSLVQELLRRSGQLPLSLFVYTLEKPVDRRVVRRIAEALKEHSNRWQELCVEVVDHHFPLFGKLLKTPTSFQTLILRCYPPNEAAEYGYSDYFYDDLDMNLLKPVSVTLYRVTPSDWEPPFIQWNHAVEVTITRATLDDFYDILTQAAILQDCRIYGIRSGFNYTVSAKPISHSHLQEFELDAAFPDEDLAGTLNDLFDLLTLPALETLCIRLTEDDISSSTLIAFLRRSSCELKVLRIGHIDDLLSLLEAIPSLETLGLNSLHLFHRHSPDSLFQALSESPSGQAASTPSRLLPKLRHFEYTTDDPKSFPWKLIPPVFGSITGLQDGLDRRPLQSLHIRLDTESQAPFLMDIHSIHSFLSIKEAGFDLRIIDDEKEKDILEPLLLGIEVWQPEGGDITEEDH